MGVGASRSLRMTGWVGASRLLRMTVWYFALRSEPCGEAFTLRCALLKTRDPSSAKRTQDDAVGVGASRSLRMTVWYFTLRSEPCGEAFTLRSEPYAAPRLSAAEAGRVCTLPAPPASIRFSTEPTKPAFSLCPVLPKVPQWCQTPCKTLSSGERRLDLFLPQHGRRINRTNQLG